MINFSLLESPTIHADASSAPAPRTPLQEIANVAATIVLIVVGLAMGAVVGFIVALSSGWIAFSFC
jgi:ABC-type nitrate/sulfonate/bicarbonate transport system permease component